MISDDRTTVVALKQLMADFVEERNWRQFHDAKNLSACIAIEAAELMEHFQWLHSDEVAAVTNDTRQMAEIEEELADILAYVLSFANSMRIDLSAAFAAKMKKNAVKYPVDRYYGSFRPLGRGEAPVDETK